MQRESRVTAFSPERARNQSDAVFNSLRRLPTVHGKNHPGAGTYREYWEVKRGLPTVNGYSFEKTVNKLVRERDAQGIDTPVSIMDLGFGEMRGNSFIEGCVAKWGKKVRVIGYGDTGGHATGENNTLSAQERAEAVGIKLIDGNIVALSETLRANGIEGVDVIVSHFAMQHVIYPSWEIIREIYHSLNVGGRAFLHFDGFHMYTSVEELVQPDEMGRLESIAAYRITQHVQKKIPGFELYTFERIEGVDIDDVGVHTTHVLEVENDYIPGYGIGNIFMVSSVVEIDEKTE